jgi:hypothetical protein
MQPVRKQPVSQQHQPVRKQQVRKQTEQQQRQPVRMQQVPVQPEQQQRQPVRMQQVPVRRFQPEQLQEQQLLLFCRKQPGQQPTGTRSTVFFS